MYQLDLHILNYLLVHSKMKFASQRFQKLQLHDSTDRQTRRQTDRRDRVHYIAALRCCDVVVCRPSARLYWSKRDGPMPSRGRYRLPSNSYNSELEIDNLQQSDEGDYVCRAENTEGSQETVIHLDVQGLLLDIFIDQ